MPVIFEKQIDTAKKLAVWHITESESELFEFNNYTPNVSFGAKRNRELAVCSILLNYILGYDAHLNLTKDKFGKPFLDNSDIAVSFSHSQQMVACMVDMAGNAVGIDIEKRRDRINMLADKFCTEGDYSDFEETMHYHCIWGGKEVLYKLYAKKELDFRETLSVGFKLNVGVGRIHKGDYKATYCLGLDMIDDYVLVWGY
jgi:hypothetical protein